MISKLEECFIPVVSFVFERHLIDAYEDALVLIDSMTGALKSVNPVYWSLIQIIFNENNFNDCFCDYWEEIFPVLDNMVLYDPKGFSAVRMHVAPAIKFIMSDLERFSEIERIIGSKLMITILISCKGCPIEQVQNIKYT